MPVVKDIYMQAQAHCEGNQCFISGDLDFLTVPKLWKESLPMVANMPELTFDLSKVTSANSAGVTLLIEWLKFAQIKNKTITFVNIPDSILSLKT